MDRLGEGVLAVRSLAHDLHVLLGVEDHPETGADELLVVHEQDADSIRSCCLRRLLGVGDFVAVGETS